MTNIESWVDEDTRRQSHEGIKGRGEHTNERASRQVDKEMERVTDSHEFHMHTAHQTLAAPVINGIAREGLAGRTAGRRDLGLFSTSVYSLDILALCGYCSAARAPACKWLSPEGEAWNWLPLGEVSKMARTRLLPTAFWEVFLAWYQGSSQICLCLCPFPGLSIQLCYQFIWAHILK